MMKKKQTQRNRRASVSPTGDRPGRLTLQVVLFVIVLLLLWAGIYQFSANNSSPSSDLPEGVEIVEGEVFSHRIVEGTSVPQQSLLVDGVTIYTVPEEDVRIGGTIEPPILFSPKRNYVAFGVTLYESFRPVILEVETKKNIISKFNPVFGPEDIFWFDGENVLVIKSAVDEFAAEGFYGVLVSDYGRPSDLREVYRHPRVNLARYNVSVDEIEYDEGILSFKVVSRDLEDSSSTSTAKTYRYNVHSKKLTED